jgi:hypothetical protein
VTLFKTTEEKAADRAAKDAEREAARAALQAEREAARVEEERLKAEQEYREFLATPVGQARAAYERGDHVFQYSLDVMNQRPIIFTYVHTQTKNRTTDPLAILNAVANEGWGLVNGSFVFVEQGARSNKALLTNGETTAILGSTVGFYLFKRCEENKREQS